MSTKYYFKDFDTGKIRYTKGKFAGWQRGGIINIWGAVFMRDASMLFIPHYLLTRETLANLPSLNEHKKKLNGDTD